MSPRLLTDNQPCAGRLNPEISSLFRNTEIKFRIADYASDAGSGKLPSTGPTRAIPTLRYPGDLRVRRDPPAAGADLRGALGPRPGHDGRARPTDHLPGHRADQPRLLQVLRRHQPVEFLRYIKGEMLLALGTAATEVVLLRIMVKLTSPAARAPPPACWCPPGTRSTWTARRSTKAWPGCPARLSWPCPRRWPRSATEPSRSRQWLMASMRVSVNPLGNCIATFVVANREGQPDKRRAADVLNGRPVAALREDACRTTNCRATTCRATTCQCTDHGRAGPGAEVARLSTTVPQGWTTGNVSTSRSQPTLDLFQTLPLSFRSTEDIFRTADK